VDLDGSSTRAINWLEHESPSPILSHGESLEEDFAIFCCKFCGFGTNEPTITPDCVHPLKMKLTARVEPRKYFTLDYWRLDTPRASFATRHGWSNADVDVVPPERRLWRPYGTKIF